MTKQQFASEAQALAPSLRRVALSIVHSEHDAQDAVQQALLGVWERRERVDASRLKAYLTRAVINACRDVQRARMRSVPVETITLVPQYADENGEWVERTEEALTIGMKS